MDSVISTATVVNTFQCLQQGKEISDAAPHNTLLYSLARFFKSLFSCCDEIRQEIEAESAALANSKDEIYLPLLKFVLDPGGHLHQPDELPRREILFEIDGATYVMTQENDGLFIKEQYKDNDGVVHGNGPEVYLKNMTVSSLKVAALKRYLQDQRLKQEPAELRECDFAGLDLSEVDFNGAVISVQNLTQIVAGRGKLNGTIFQPRTKLTAEQMKTYLVAGGSDLRGAGMDDHENNAGTVVMGKVAIGIRMAMGLIQGGANRTTVLIRYLQTEKMQAESNSQLHIEAWMALNTDRTVASLKRNELETIQKKKLRDYSYIELCDFPLEQIDTDKVLEAGLGLEYAFGINNLTPLGALRNVGRRPMVRPSVEQLILYADELEDLHANEVVLTSKPYGVHGELYSFKKCQTCAESCSGKDKNRKDFFWNMLMACHSGITPGAIENNLDLAISKLMLLLPCSDELKTTLTSYLKGSSDLPYGIRLKDFFRVAPY